MTFVTPSLPTRFIASLREVLPGDISPSFSSDITSTIIDPKNLLYETSTDTRATLESFPLLIL